LIAGRADKERKETGTGIYAGKLRHYRMYIFKNESERAIKKK